jgi:hypothetical protein
MPERIQLRRTKGWRKPEGAVIVSRPSRWGNWWVVEKAGKRLEHYESTLVAPNAWVVRGMDKHGRWDRSQFGGFATQVDARAFAVSLYRHHLEGTYLDVGGPQHRQFYLGDLAGRDLACWCPLDSPCHADVLLSLANGWDD